MINVHSVHSFMFLKLEGEDEKKNKKKTCEYVCLMFSLILVLARLLLGNCLISSHLDLT